MNFEIDVCRLLTEDSVPGVPKVLFWKETYENLIIIMNFVDGGSLNQWHKLIREQEQSMKINCVREVFYEILKSFQRIHSLGIVHRDIKLDNIMVDTSKGPIIIDFGLSTILLKDEKCQQSAGTLAFLSPEIVGHIPHDRSTDVWSLGILLYTLLTSRLPFVSKTIEETRMNILKNPLNLKQSCWAQVPEAAKDLVSRMLKKAPRERITIREALSHPWFNDI